MDKPVSLSIKDWIIRNMSTRMNVPERTIEAVVNHQFDGAYEAMKTKFTIEFSGWGKLIFNKKKAKFRMRKLLWQKHEWQNISKDMSRTPQQRHSAAIKLMNANKSIEELKVKMDDYENTFREDLRRLEEQAISSFSSEGDN